MLTRKTYSSPKASEVLAPSSGSSCSSEATAPSAQPRARRSSRASSVSKSCRCVNSLTCLSVAERAQIISLTSTVASPSHGALSGFDTVAVADSDMVSSLLLISIQPP